MTAWTVVASVTFDAVAAPLTHLTIFRAMSASPTSGPLTITFSGSQSNCQWIASQWNGVDITGTNGAGAIVQTGTNHADGGNGLAVTLGAFGNANDVAYGVFGVKKNVVAVTPGTGFVEIDEQPSAEGTQADLEAEWATNDNSIDATWANLSGGALGVEIKAGNPGPGVDASRSTVSAAPAVLTAGVGASTITVTAMDGSGHPVSGVTVTLSATGSGNMITPPAGPTDPSGMVTGSLSSTGAGPKAVTAVAGGVTLTQQPVVMVAAGLADATQSTVSAAPASIVAGGGTSTITATVRDAFGNPVSGSTVVLSTSGTNYSLTQPVGLTTASGVATGTLTSTDVQALTVSATADGTAIGQTATVTVTSQPPPGSDVVLVGAGDIASCLSTGDEATASLLDNIPGTVFTAGDNAYENGSPTDYSQCYDPSWGRHKARTRPAPGNHDYATSGASGYFGYYGDLAGPSGLGYYSYDIGAWHIVSLNSNVSMSAGSPQEQWLRADLAASTKQCTIALWHHPRFSSGTKHGSTVAAQPLWQALYDAGAEIVISGHEHNYERFAPQTPTGLADPGRGIREFVVGTGGDEHYNDQGTPLPNSEVFNGTTFGVLKLTLGPGTYSWEFIPVAGQTFTDAGSGSCR